MSCSHAAAPGPSATVSTVDQKYVSAKAWVVKTTSPQHALGAAVKAAREAMGVSQEEFAATVGMHRTQLGHIEQGKKDCRLSTIVRLANALGLSPSSLIKKVG